MRFTIERLRTLVLMAAVLLLVALGVFLVRARWKNYLNRRDLPQRLAKDIVEEANGFDYVHAFGAHSQFKIHASKVVQLKDNRMLLHEVRIEIYGEDGNRVDQIDGNTFEYDQKSGLAIAEGPVEMVLTRPAPAPRAAGNGSTASSRPSAAGAIHLKTSAVTFDQDTGMVATAQRVDFTIKQGYGSAVGALYDSQNGYLTLDHSVELTTERGKEPVEVHAQHAEFDRAAQVCLLRAVRLNYRGGEADAAQARVFFRTDGSAQRLDAAGGFAVQTATGGQVAAPTAQIDFDERNQPRHGLLQGGVTMSSVEDGRTMHGTSSTAELAFTGEGHLRQAQLGGGVNFETEQTVPGQAAALTVTRTWRSPKADADFRESAKGQSMLASAHGTGGVVITSESRSGGAAGAPSNPAAAPSELSANDVTAAFGENSALQTLTGIGHAAIEQTTADGARQTASGDRLDAQFAPAAGSKAGAGATVPGAVGVESAEVDGHVVLVDQAGARLKAPLRATAGKAVYADAGQWLHLTINPRVEYGGLEIAADKVDVSQESGEAFAHGDVKGTFVNTGGSGADGENVPARGANFDTMAPSGKGPAHVIAAEAQMNESTGEATFRGHARLWQFANSVTAPVIMLNQHLQTLMARSSNPQEPVRAVLLSAGGAPTGLAPRQNANGKTGAPSVIRVRGGELWYSEPEHRAVMRAGALGAVIAETGTATSTSDSVDLQLMPATNQEGQPSGQTQVDRMTAAGNVKLTSQGRRGTGEQLQYASVTGEYVLTGTAGAPPRLTDPQHGTATGEALIFNSRDDSVSIEGGGRETITETTAPAR